MPITATRFTTFRPLNGDQDGDNRADAGDVLRHTLTFTNTGTAATGVTVNDLLGGSTETGLVNISPIALDDNFTAVGNTALRVGGAANIGTGPSSQVAGNLMSNDIGSTTIGPGPIAGDDITGFTIDTVSNGLTAGGGTFNIFSDGSFNYVSEAGDTVSDTFTYTIRDAGINGVAGDSDDTTSTATVTITLSGQVWYVDSAAAPGTGTGTSNNPFGTLTSVQAVDSDGDYVYVKGNAVPGTLVMEANELLIGTGEALTVSGFNLATAGSNSTINNSGSGLTLSTDNTIKGVTINNTDANAVGIQDGGGSVGTLTIDTVSISGTGKAIDIDAGGTLAVDIDSLSSSSSATQGVHLQGVTGSFNATTGHIQTSGQQGFLIGAAGGGTASSGGTATITYGGAITSSTGSNVEIQDRTGGTVTFSGNITDGAIANGGHGILLDGNAGTVNFTGQVFLTAGATTGQGVLIGANAATVNFNATGTGLDISTTSGAGFSASGGGTVNVTGSANTIASTSATALSVSGTTIGSSGLNFFSIAAGNNTAAAEPTNGIVLANTGTLGGLTVTGDGGGANNGTGGTIQNTLGDGISLTNTMNVVLGRMNITGVDGMGINGNGVYGIVLTRLNISGSGDSAAADEGGIRILELTGDASHVTQFNNISVTNSFEHNVFIRNTGGTLSNLVVANSTFSNNGASTQAGMHFIFEANTGGLGGTPTMTAHFTGNTFTGSTTVGQLTSHALQAAANDGLLTIFIGDGTVGGRNIFTTNAVGLDLDTSGAGNLNFNVNNNVLTDTTSNAINIFRGASSSGTVNGFVTNNVIGTQGVATSGSEVGSGVRVGSEGGGITRVLIDSNIIQSIGVNGVSGGPNIDLTQGIASPPGGYVDGTMHATVINNTLRDNADSRAMNATARNGTINLDFHGNTLSGITGTSGTFIRMSASSLVPSDDGVFNLPQASLAAVAAANTGLTTGQISSNGTINFNQAAPQMPTAFLFVEAPGPLVEDEPEAGDGTPPADPAPTPSGQPIVVDDGVISQAELALIVEAAIQRWADSGATAEQIAAMRATTVTVANLPGLMLGSSAAGEIVIDHNAAGFNWFIDATPGDDSEYSGDGTLLGAIPGTVAAIRIDLLTTIMHELGHQIGLEDNYASADADELMYGSISIGERRLPGADDAAEGDGTHVTGTAFILTQITLGTIPAGRTVTIQWDSTVNAYTNQIIPTFSNTSSVGGSSPATSNPETMGPGLANDIVMDSLTLGGTLWNDDGAGGGIAGNGIKDGTEAGHAGVTLTLFADTGSTPGVWDATDAELVTGLLTDASGNYAFTGLAPGNYIVRVDADNFNAGGNVSLVGHITTAGSPDPDDNIDNDDNGSESGGAVYSQTITLSHGDEPDGVPGGPGDTDGDADPDTNLTLDFGFVYLNQAPVNTVPAAAQVFDEDGSVTFSAANGNAISVADADAGAGSLMVTLTIADGVLTPMAGSGATIGGTANALTITGTLTQINAALNGLIYTPPADANGPRTLTILTNDQGNTGFDPGLTGNATSEEDSDPVAITINAVNDTPVVSLAASGSSTEQVAGTVDAVATISDIDLDALNGGNGNYAGATLNIANNGGNDANDLFAIGTSGAFTVDSFTVDSGNLEAGGQVFATYSGGIGAPLVISFTSGGTTPTTALVNAVLQSIQYTYTGDNPPVTGIDVAISLNDGAPANAGQGSIAGHPAVGTDIIHLSITNTPENQPPVVDLNGSDGGNDFASAYTEDGTAAVIADTDVAITDADVGDQVEGATITITDAVFGDQLTVLGVLPGTIVAAGGGTATVTLSGTGTQAEYQQALTQIRYSTTGNNPTVGGTDLTRSITVTVDDGEDSSAPATTTVTVTGSNDPPAGTDATITLTEDTPRLLAQADFGFTDPDSADAFSAVTITGVTGGTLYYDADGTGGAGLPVAVGSFPQTYTAAELASGNVSYQANSNLNGTGVGTLGFQVIDNSGAVNNTDPSGNTLTFDVTPINDQPSIPNSPTVTTDEQVAVTLNAAITVSDADLDARNGGAGDYSGAAFAINRSVSDAEDVFSFDTAGAQFTVNGSNLESGGNVIATLAQSGGILNINFVNSGTVPTTALVNDVLQHLQYTNTSNEPPASVTLIYIIDDGAPGGGQGALGAPFNNIDGGQITVNINSVNDAPAGADKLFTIDEDANQVLATADFGFSDTDNDVLDAVVVVTVTGGSILLDDGNIVTPPVSLTSGTISAADIAAGYVSFQPTAHLNGSGAGTISFQVRDNGGTANSGQNTDQSANTITFDIDSVNDAPAGTSGSVTGSEDDPYVFALADFGYSDTADGDDFAGVIFTTVPTTGTLFYDADGPGGAAPVALADGAGPIAAADIAAGRVYFVPVADAFGSPYATFTFQVQDDGGIANGGQDTDQSPNTITINIAQDNLPPAVDLDGGTGGVNYTASFTEDGAAVAIGSGVTVTDPNSGTGDMIESATVVLTDRVAGDSLTITGALPPGITAVTTPTAGAITIQITGAGTGAQYQALIESIQYATTSQDPTVGGTDPARTITVTANDGVVDSAVATTTVNITALDDAAVAQNDAFATDEATAITTGNVLANNGSGADSDVDGPTPTVSGVTGGTVGSQFTLPSGALLTLNANGTFNYNPNGAFDRTPTPGSGASNQPALDSFIYTLTGGDTAMVTITITGLDTNDLLLGTSGADTLSGGAGNDLYRVEQAGDVVNESVGGGFDAVYVALALSSYTLAAGSEVELLSAIDPSSTVAMDLTGNAFDNTLIGTAGSNTLIGGRGVDVMAGLGGNDFYRVEQAGDVVLESVGGGFDSVYVALALGSYTLQEGYEIELVSAIDPSSTVAFDLTGNGFGNTIIGTAGSNTLIGGGGNDVLAGGAGDDFYRVEDAGDVVLEYGGGGFDSVYVALGLGSYTLQEGYEIELLSAIDPAAMVGMNLTGNEFANTIIGTGGANVLNGGRGADVLLGSGGADTFAFTTALGGGNVDTILDFTAASIDGDDIIHLDDAVFAGLALGALDPGAFRIGSAAQDGDDRIIFDASTGALYFDADGNGAGVAIQFATLSGVTALTSADFIVI